MGDVSKVGRTDIYAPGSFMDTPSVFPKVELSDGTIAIRQFEAGDGPLLYTAVRESLPEIRQWMVWCHPEYSLEDSASFINRCPSDWQKGVRFSFVIQSHHNSEFLGSVGLSQIDPVHKVGSIGYWVRTTRTRRGAASAGLRLAARFGFDRLGLQRVELVIPVGNAPSMRVAEKAGARFEGVLRKRIMLNGKSCDAAIYSLVNRLMG
ncbi:MAG TPA: GNAT family protein [Candidatus Dormibacteraeota bacterium]|nr:GNAT family protein [Candidatus Dormibacteraeota bacterium]